MNKLELKSCPFCGGDAEIKTSVSSGIPKTAQMMIICKKCRASTSIFNDVSGNGNFFYEAIDAWNRRVE